MGTDQPDSQDESFQSPGTEAQGHEAPPHSSGPRSDLGQPEEDTQQAEKILQTTMTPKTPESLFLVMLSVIHTNSMVWYFYIFLRSFLLATATIYWAHHVLGPPTFQPLTWGYSPFPVSNNVSNYMGGSFLPPFGFLLNGSHWTSTAHNTTWYSSIPPLCVSSSNLIPYCIPQHSHLWMHHGPQHRFVFLSLGALTPGELFNDTLGSPLLPCSWEQAIYPGLDTIVWTPCHSGSAHMYNLLGYPIVDWSPYGLLQANHNNVTVHQVNHSWVATTHSYMTWTNGGMGSPIPLVRNFTYPVLSLVLRPSLASIPYLERTCLQFLCQLYYFTIFQPL